MVNYKSSLISFCIFVKLKINQEVLRSYKKKHSGKKRSKVIYYDYCEAVKTHLFLAFTTVEYKILEI